MAGRKHEADLPPKVGDLRPAGKCSFCEAPLRMQYQTVNAYHDDTTEEWRLTPESRGHGEHAFGNTDVSGCITYLRKLLRRTGK